jgi:predicted Zn-dependent peptidase
LREEIKATAGISVLLVWFFIILMVLGTASAIFGLFFNRKAMPYQEETRRLTYQQSATHQEGSQNNFMDLCVQYASAPNDAAKDMIRAAIRQRKSVYAGPPLSSDVESCFAKIGL